MEKPTVKVYAANPSGFCDNTRIWLRDVLLPRLSGPDVDLFDPWAHLINKKSAELLESLDTMTHGEAMSIGRANSESIDRCDVVFAVLDGTDVDSGVAAEIGYAVARGKRIIGVRTDFRPASEVPRVCRVNLQLQAFIEQSGGKVYDSVDDAVLGFGAFVAFKRGEYNSEEKALKALQRNGGKTLTRQR